MRRDDYIRIRHMPDAAQEAVSFINNHSRAGLEDNRMLVLSLVKSIEIIGEAASKVTKESREGCPEVPWSYQVAFEGALRRRRGADAGVHVSTSRSVTRRQQR